GTTPLSVLENYKAYRNSHLPLPFLVSVSPPEVNFERVSSAPSGLPKMETELAESLRTFLEKNYAMTSGCPVRFLGGAWNSKAVRYETAYDSICTVFAEVPLLIIESEVGANLKLNLRVLARDIGQVHTQSKAILSDFDCQAFINRLAKAEALQWRELREKFIASDKLDALKKHSKNIQLKEDNVATLLLEEATGESLAYSPTEQAHQELKRFLGTVHCLLTGMASDEFFFAHYRVMPQLPHLLPQLLLGFSPEDTVDIVQIVREHYQGMAESLLMQQSPYAPFLAVDVAMGLSSLSDKRFAVQQLQAAAEVFLAEKGQNLQLVAAQPVVEDVQWLAQVLPFCSAADDAFMSALYGCFAKLENNSAKLLISDRKEAIKREEAQKLESETARQNELAYQKFLAEQAAKAEQDRLAKEKGIPLIFNTLKAGKLETVTVFEKTFDIAGTQLVMVYIPEGTLQAGNKTFTLQPFYMGKFPVTQAQYEAVMGDNPSNWKGKNLPVERVYWKQAREFCQKLSALLKNDFRLPSEAEWEYACRAGTTTEYWWGDNMDNSRCWYDKNSGSQTHRVDEKVNEHVNPFGLCDMHGNVWEWCQDEWHGDFADANADGTAYGSEDNDCSRLLRGGSWVGNADVCRSAVRSHYSGRNDGYGGFRVVFPVPRILHP
ncbi:MAG: hypothetical protein RL368_2161, partial [Pseudomonadota bacterium]